jgi:organic hydroperoxide reductase OsmC/OhrA
MASYTASLTWTRDEAVFSDGQYSRAHEITFDGGVTVSGSSSPHIVKLPMSREDAVDPEEMLVAALSSCHMLTFLDLARRAGFVIDAYSDKAEGKMAKDERGRLAITQVKLNPIVIWAGDKAPEPEAIRELHHKAHELCFIANSFRGDIAIGGGEAH